MLIMKTVCVSFVIFQMSMIYSNAQMKPSNWDQRGNAPGTNFFGQDSDADARRRNFFGNDFQPGDVFPGRSSPGGTDSRRQAPPTIGGTRPGNTERGQTPRAIPPPIRPRPSQTPSVEMITPTIRTVPANTEREVARRTPPPMGQNPEPIAPSGVMEPGIGRNQPPAPQPLPGQGQIGSGEEKRIGVGQARPPSEPSPIPKQQGSAGGQGSFTGAGPQLPVNRGPIGNPRPIAPEPPMSQSPDEDGGIIQGAGRQEGPNPNIVPPMMEVPNQRGIDGERGLQPPTSSVQGNGQGPLLNRPPSTPEVQPGPRQSPLQPSDREDRQMPPRSQNPDELMPGQDMGRPGQQFGDQEMMKNSQRPVRQGADGRRQSGLPGQVRGVGQNPTGYGGRPMGAQRQGNSYNRPSK